MEKTLFLGKIEVRRRRGRQRMRWLDGIAKLMDMNLGKVGGREAWCHAAIHGVTRSWQLNSNIKENTKQTHLYSYHVERASVNMLVYFILSLVLSVSLSLPGVERRYP